MRAKKAPSTGQNYVKHGLHAVKARRKALVNISHVVIDRKLRPLDFHWERTTTNIVNNGHTIQFNIDAGSRGRCQRQNLTTCLQFHFHHLSEHTIDGNIIHWKVHYVHSATDGKMAGHICYVHKRTSKCFV
jgi:carbonic anhydrase